MLCQRAHGERGSSWKGELPKETIRHIQGTGWGVWTKGSGHHRSQCVHTGAAGIGTLWDQDGCNRFGSKEELWEAARDEELKIPWKEANQWPPVTEEQYQEIL
jgi:hypothetical protein